MVEVTCGGIFDCFRVYAEMYIILDCDECYDHRVQTEPRTSFTILIDLV